MTAKSLHLNKLLKLFQLPDNKLKSALRAELRQERKKMDEGSGGGGDFYVPFWADAKLHVIGAVDLKAQTDFRISTSKQRRRLYPILMRGFLDWLERVRRSTNETVGWREGSVHRHVLIEDLDLTVKLDNFLSLAIGDDLYRLVYPYFCESPRLDRRWARVALWIMSEAFPEHDRVNMEVLDVMRGESFSGAQVSLKGDEEMLFRHRYLAILEAWDSLRPEYGL